MDRNLSFYEQNTRSMKKKPHQIPEDPQWLSAISLKREEIKQMNFVYLSVFACLFQRIKTHP